jgi:hypothetical protein
LPWSGVTNKPPVFKEEAVSENPSFDNIYKGGVDIYTTSTGITVTSNTAAWGNAGVWDNTPDSSAISCVLLCSCYSCW